jgi:Zn-dependent protease
MGVLRVVVGQEASGVTRFIYESARAGVTWNVILMVLNLLPILPLDGGRIVSGLLPNRMAYSYSRLEPYGMLILIFLLVFHMLDWLLGPLVETTLTTLNTLYSVFGF